MAFRSRRSSARGGFRRGSGSYTGRRTSGRRTSSARRRRVTRASAPQTLRIVIEGISGSNVARPVMPAKPASRKKL